MKESYQLQRDNISQAIECIIKDYDLIAVKVLKENSLEEAKEAVERLKSYLYDYLELCDNGVCDMCIKSCVGEFRVRNWCRKFEISHEAFSKFENFCKTEYKLSHITDTG